MKKLTEHSTLRELWENPVGHDVLAKLLMQLGRSERWLTNPAVSRLTILALIGKYREGGAGKIPQILLRRGREMKIRCDRVSMVNLDGERMDTDELSIRLSAKKVNFFFPQGAHWNPSRRGENEIIKENRRKQEIEAY